MNARDDDDEARHGSERDRLRAAFDATFAELPPPPELALVPLVLVTIGEERHAVRASGIAALGTRARIDPVPSRDPAFVGLVADRGRLVPVFTLRVMLAFVTNESPRRDASRAPSEGASVEWLLFVGHEERAAFVVDSFAGHCEAPPEAFAPSGSTTTRAVVEVVRTPEGSVPVIDPAALMTMLRERTT